MSELPMTPEQARDDLEYLPDFEVGDVYNTCRRALETITGMKEEWAIEGGWRRGEDITWHPVTDWYSSREQAESTTPALSPRIRLVRRYVTRHEVIDGE